MEKTPYPWMQENGLHKTPESELPASLKKLRRNWPKLQKRAEDRRAKEAEAEKAKATKGGNK